MMRLGAKNVIGLPESSHITFIPVRKHCLNVHFLGFKDNANVASGG